MSTSVDIGHLGEEAVRRELVRQHYSDIKVNTYGAGATDITAKSPATDLQFFQVKTAVFPSTPDDLDEEEKAAIKARAKRNDGTAYLAQVQLDRNFNVTNIHYTKL
ncbi:MAG: hypothetical protein WB661_12340 [Candidatus Bathyarchaeia archaeon]